MKQIPALLFVCVLLTACEKWPFPKDGKDTPVIEKVTLYDSEGKEISEFQEGLELKIVSEQLADIIKNVDLVKEGQVVFGKIKAPITRAEKDFIITRVPPLNLIETTSIQLAMSYQNQNRSAILCPTCGFFYRPRVHGEIIAGYAADKPDGTFTLPAEMTLDAAGNLYVIDQRTTHDVVLKVTPTGVTTTFAGAAGEFGRLVGIGIDAARNAMYVADATTDRIWKIDMTTPTTVTTLAGSGTAGNADGTGTAASFRIAAQPVSDFGMSETGQGLTVDNAGNIFIGENGPTSSSSQLRKITPEGVVTTVAGSQIVPAAQADVAMPAGVFVNSATGDLSYVSGSSGYFQGITRITTAGVRSRLAGKTSFEGLNDGTGTIAQFSYPKAITGVGALLYVADGTNGALRRVSATGNVITLAGVGHFQTNRFCGCGDLPPLQGSFLMPSLVIIPPTDYFETAAAAIRMDQVGGVAAQSNNLIYVSDHGYRCIWKITIH